MPTRWRGQAEIRRRAGAGSHTLVVGGDDQVRAGATAWVEHELSAGSKVLYKGWLRSDLEHHWLFVDPASPARAALAIGQLEFVDFPTVVQICGGTTEGLAALQRDEVRSAVDDGWATVALAQETTYRPMATAEEAHEFARQERTYDLLAERWPINTLCQLSLTDEVDAAVRESAAVHHGELVAVRWSARTIRGRWSLAGELDIAVHREFAAALEGRIRASSRVDVEIDLRHVAFLDVACARVLTAAAGSLEAPQRLLLHRSSALTREVIETVGRPPSLIFDGPAGR